ncbi:hypothetical protein BV455_02934 [Parageobacillus caldoxylosilyticus]|nr:hypothetical protein BV455_02934 [Parageobacillus caldoxylosilyticus]
MDILLDITSGVVSTVVGGLILYRILYWFEKYYSDKFKK